MTDPLETPGNEPNRLRALIGGLASAYHTIASVRLLTLGFVAGIFSGVAAILFFLGVEWLRHYCLNVRAGVELPAPAGEQLFHAVAEVVPRPWLIPIMTTLTGLVTGWLLARYAPNALLGGTDGTDAMIRAFHRQDGVIRLRTALLRSSTAILTIATGGSAGREGPISLLGAGLGSWLARRFGLTTRERRLLLLAGAAGGLGAIFSAPLGGALTAVEVLYREDFEAEAILPSVISSVTAYTLFTLAYGTDPMFGIPNFHFHNALELPFYLVLALVCAATGFFYVKTFRTIKFHIFARLWRKVGPVWCLGAGGLAMGLLGMFFPMLLSGGYGWLELAILGQMPALTMLLLLFGKTLATSITLGSGMSGGMFAPALFVGGLSGGLVGKVAHHYFPQIATQPGGYVLVGMAAFFAGVAKAPIGPLIMVCELTQGYGLLAPLLLASAVCLVVNRKVSLYENQVDSKFDSPAHIEDATINVLEGLNVADYMRPGPVTTLEEGAPFKAMTDMVANSNQFTFPVRDARGAITGLISVQNLRRVLFEDCLCDLLVAKDVAGPAVLLHPDHDLYTALLAFVDADQAQLPVVSPGNSAVVLGLLSREDVFAAYSAYIRSIREGG